MKTSRGFPGGPVVKSSSHYVGDEGSIPAQGAKGPRAAKQLCTPQRVRARKEGSHVTQ